MNNMKCLKLLVATSLVAVSISSGGQLVTDNLDVMGTASFYGEVNIGFDPSALMTNGLALYYSFNTNNGGVVLDNSGNTHTGVVTGATWTNAGYWGGGYYLDGNDYMTAGDIFDVTGSLTDLTVCVWMKMPTSINSYPHVVGKQMNGSPYTGWALMLYPGDKPLSLIYGGPVADAYGITPIPTGSWHFMCATFKVRSSSLEANVYLDGIREAADIYSGSLSSTDTSAPFTIGARNGGGLDFFTGYVDEVRVYNRAFSDDEITALYAHYLGIPPGKLNVKDLIVENKLVQTGSSTNILMGPTGIGVTNPVVGQLQVGGMLNVDGNIRLNNNWLSGDGDNEGVSVSSSGTVTILKMIRQGDIEMGTFTNHP
jgi:Concanavalin A-like lectin/glucanases superfamily